MLFATRPSIQSDPMAQVHIKFFGPARDIVGASAIQQEIFPNETVGMLAGKLADTYPKLGQSLGLRLAVNRSYVPLSHPLADGDEVAVIPPVSGGSPSAPLVLLVRSPIDHQAIFQQLNSPQSGAVASFLGTVRAEENAGTTLAALEYSAYDDMAVEQMQAIREAAIRNFHLINAAIVHRLGRLKLGETSIAVACVSAHRAEAFDACRWIVDAVKTDVPIWKKDIWANGAENWVEPTCS